MKTTCVAADTIDESTTTLSEFEHGSVAEGQEDNIIRVCAGACSVECSCTTQVSDVGNQGIKVRQPLIER